MSQERNRRQSLRRIAARVEALGGTVLLVGAAGSGYIYYGPEAERSKESFDKLPTTLTFYMDKTSGIGIPGVVVLGAFTLASAAITIDGVRKLRRLRARN